MAKRKGGGGGGANWMDTYGDMVTLLLCFFVLLYSMSTISEEKFKAIVQSFNPNAARNPTEIIPGGNEGPSADDPAENPSEQLEIEEMMEDLLAAFQQYAGQEGLEDTISVNASGGRIFVELMDKAMFYANEADMKPGAEEILQGVCNILDKSKGAIEVIEIQGHTAQGYDDRPNDVRDDRELSSERATEVTIFIQEHSSIHPARLKSVGMGQWYPIGNNQGEEGKAPNRRVELVISAKEIGSELNQELAKLTAETGGAAQQPQASPAPTQSPT